MEEKERYYYKKILRDCVMPEGLFEIKDRESNFYLIIENKKDVDTITNLLNQQDKRIKALEFMNNRLSQGIYWGNGEHFCDVVKRLKEENQQLKEEVIYHKNFIKDEIEMQCHFLEDNMQLKHSQKRLAINELERVNSILTDTIIEVTQNEMNIDKLAYLEEISASFGQKINDRIRILEKK